MKHKMSRMESNREVRRILNKHGVNLGYCQYSCCGKEVRLSGWLCKQDESDYNGMQIESMIQDFQRLMYGYTIVGEFDNWVFSTDHIMKLAQADEEVHEDDSEEEAEAS